MPTLHLAAELTRQDLFRATAELSADELEQFAAEVVALRDLRSGKATALTDEELVRLIRHAVPEALHQRLRQLDALRRSESLAAHEHSELLRLVDDYENRNAERIWALGQLATRRQTTIAEVMQSLGIQPTAPYE